MKKIKVILLFLVVTVLTGCAGTYNININKDLTVNEEATITVSKDSKNKIEKLFSDNNISKDKYSIREVNDNLKITYNQKYDSVGDYVSNSILYNELFDITEYDMNTKNISLIANSKFKNDNTTSLDNISNSFDIKNLVISVTTPFDTSNNADEIIDNKLVWKINQNTTSKTINLNISFLDKSIRISSFIIPAISLIVLIIVIILYRRFNRRNGTEFY